MHNLIRIFTKDRTQEGQRSGFRLGLGSGLVLLLPLLVAACSSAAPTSTSLPAPSAMPAPTETAVPEAGVTPTVAVEDQQIVDGAVMIAKAVSAGPGWLVIHADAEGKPGLVLGQTGVQDGENTDVVVELDMSGLTGKLFAMLHTDVGQVGTYEFPGDDVPVKQGDDIVMSAFNLQATGGAADVSMVNFSFNPAQLVVGAGTTVTWTNSDGGVSHTTTSDADLWNSGLLSAGETFSFTFEEPGVYPYYCQPHGGPGAQGMSGTIIVIPETEHAAAVSDNAGHEHEEEDHMAGDVHGVPEDAAHVPNPIAATEDSIAAGATLFATSCSVCHGETGMGDGPSAAALDPKPANLGEHHVQDLTDGALFYIISNGVEGTAMPAWEGTLSEEEIWNIVNLLRTFGEE